MTPSDRATQAWVARQFGVSTNQVKPMTDAGEIPIFRIHEGVRKNGDPFTQYRYSKRMILAYLRRRGELAAERADGAA